MRFSISLVTFALLPLSEACFATNDNHTTSIEVITIQHQRNDNPIEQSFAKGQTSEVDLAHWLSSLPGANINRNGPITGIAQYRGLFGDRIATTINGQPIIGAGPNAMDTPLSYSTPLLVDSMTVYRGIAPVSAGIDTLGGAINIESRKAQIDDTAALVVESDLLFGYRSNNQATTVSGITNLSKNEFALLAYVNQQQGEHFKSGDKTRIKPTKFDKTQVGADVRLNHGESEFGFGYHYTDTGDSGTPALPMDIEYIRSHRVALDGHQQLMNWQFDWSFGYLDADHEMTNFLLRTNKDPKKHRRNTALADTTDLQFVLSRQLKSGLLSLGFDSVLSTHDSIITNPNNAMFKVLNFNNVKDNKFSLFVEWQQHIADTQVHIGARLKHNKSNAGLVSSSMATMSHSTTHHQDDMPNMGELAHNLQHDFNTQNRKVDDTKIDVVLSTQTQFSAPLSLYLGVGLKHRAPSYQERYLWTPMEATGGLADGHTYIGNVNLKSERALQTNIGLSWHQNNFALTPYVFYQRIDNYIQGTPLTMAQRDAKMMAKMMAKDDNPLQFNNVDAELWGTDITWQYKINQQFALSGIASYVKGTRRDISDNLYRVAPLNSQMTLSYSFAPITANITFIAVAAQSKVSQTNTEKPTSGYGLLNVSTEYSLANEIVLRGGIDNLLDRNYQNHLGGYNRVNFADTPVMQRLPNEGISAWLEASFHF